MTLNAMPNDGQLALARWTRTLITSGARPSAV